MVRVAVIQIDPRLGNREQNLRAMTEAVERAAREGAELAVLPECALTGYVYGSLEAAMEVADPIPGPWSDRVAEIASRAGIYVIAGMLERAGVKCFNSALLCGPEGLIGVYRKTHTLCLGVDRFTTPGDVPYTVYDLPIGRIGMLICYDLRFPEPARALALQGAQVIALPTNWPVSSNIQPDVFTRSRAAENRVYVLAADRVGQEAGATFLGRSQIVTPAGEVVQEAPRDQAAILFADIDLTEADRKRVVEVPGEHEMDCWNDRRPDLYGPLVLTGGPV